MEESKKKPPRPPAPPKFKKSGKTKPPSSMITMRFNPRAADDSDDDIEVGDPLQISITKKPSAVPDHTKKQTDNVPKRPNSLPDRYNSTAEKNVGKKTGEVIPAKSSPVLSSSPLSRNSSLTSTSPKDDPLHNLLDEHDPHDDLFNSNTKNVKEKKSRETHSKGKETGVLKVESEVLSPDTTDRTFEEQLGPKGGMDPLSFFSQMMEKEGKGSTDSLKALDDDKGSNEETRARNDKEPDIVKDLEVNLYHYNHPTPDELQDEPVVIHSKPAKSSQMSFRDLEKSEVDDAPSLVDHNFLKVDETDSSDRVEKSRQKVKPPKEMEVISIKETVIESLDSKESPTLPAPPEELVELPPLWLLGVISLVLFVCLMFPMPVYVNGLVTGMLVSFYASLGLVWLNLPPWSQRMGDEPIDESTPLAAPGERMSVEKVKQKVQELKVSEVWMNELDRDYDQESFHISQTKSVFIRLEGHTLRLSTPRRNIPRRAMWSDPVAPKVEFVHQRIYDIQGGKVTLQPDGLVHKRMWSKKYPIHIELPNKGKKETREEVKTAFEDETLVGGDEDDGGFVVIKDEECDERTLTLFARTGREKEEWFWRLEVAVNYDKIKGRKPIPTLYKKVSYNNNQYRDDEGNLHHVRSDTFDPLAKKGMVDFYKFIAKIIPREKDLKEVSIAPVNVKAGGVTYASPAPKGRRPQDTIGVTLDSPLAWANALVGRVFWDFLREESWASVVQAKLQKKLDKLRIPRFIEGLTITDTDLGVNAPIIKRTSPPTINNRGIWVYLDIAYAGSCCITLTTKFNPWKLRGGESKDRELDEMNHNSENHPKRRSESSSAALDSDEEDSAESSDEEAADEITEAGPRNDEGATSRVSGKFMHYVNKAANSNFFKKATQNKYVKMAFDEVSNTPVELTVELKELRGTLAVNIPPPPTDRLWYGFQTRPNLWLSAKPKLGAKQISLSRVTDYIEKKLDLEFQKVFVLPNMDDVVIPIMLFDLDEERL